MNQAAVKPNIILIYNDDLAWYGLPVRMDNGKSNSAMPILEMPNLERMAQEGVKFRNAYASAPQCAPSRVAVQSGKSSPRSGFTVYMNPDSGDYYDGNPEYAEFLVVANVSNSRIDIGENTIPKVLQPLGYVSAHFGKWHMRGDPSEENYIAHNGPTDNNPGNSRIPDDPKLMFSITDSGIQFMEEQVEADNPFYL